MLSLDSLRWRRSPVNPVRYSSSGGWSAYDSKRGALWVEGGAGDRNFRMFQPDVDNRDGTYGRWTNYAMKLGHASAVAAYDPLRDILVVASFDVSNGSARIFGIDLQMPDSPAVILKEAGSPPSSKASQSGWEWSDARGALLYWRRGSGVFELRLTGSDWRTGPWTWSPLTHPSNTVVPAEMHHSNNGVYGRFRIARYSDAEVALIANRINGPVYAFRVPEGGRAPVPREPEELLVR
jgi:hypothetical protein